MVGKSSIINVLETGLRGSSLKNKVTANNLANADTPGFRRGELKFDEILAKVLDTPGGANLADLQKIKGELYQPMNTPVNSKGNDVAIESEIGELMKGTIRHKTYLRMLNKVYKQMELAMQSRT